MTRTIVGKENVTEDLIIFFELKEEALYPLPDLEQNKFRKQFKNYPGIYVIKTK